MDSSEIRNLRINDLITAFKLPENITLHVQNVHHVHRTLF
jgi:hypothetical protein